MYNALVAFLVWLLGGFCGFFVYPGTNNRLQAAVEILVALAGGVVGGVICELLHLHVVIGGLGAFLGALILTKFERMLCEVVTLAVQQARVDVAKLMKKIQPEPKPES